MQELSPQYNPQDVEDKIYRTWEKSGFFTPEKLPGKRTKSYTVVIAPPNITGSLHMGHALENIISDILIRYKRMRGFKTLWLPGTDHGGISTNSVVEKELKKQGVSRHDLGRKKFLEKVWEWREKYGNTILNQLKSLGCSLDWSRTRFTMDEKYNLAVNTAFKHYYKKGLVYRGERVINWCTRDQTALSDLELEYVEEKTKLWYIKYLIKDSKYFMVVATTRPETMLGDTAVAVNPKDKRYEKFVGKKIILPITGREIPIIADRAVEMEFGTGAVKVTPAHDAADSAMAERNKLPYIKVISEVGKVINVGPEFDGLKIAEAREKVLAKLKESGLLEKEEDLIHNVAKCYRCGTVVEPLLSKQWFIRMKPLAEKAVKVIKKGEIKYMPERWKKIALEWFNPPTGGVRDWCISRQIWWGHKIPIDGVEDVLDTWFSSALWPFATLGWPEKTKDLKEFYPTQVITSARDILHLWITRMIFSGLEFMDEKPFGDVIIHPTILTKEGKRMSKSLGTGIDPMDLIERYGADATRFGLIWQAMGNQDIHWSEEHVVAGKKFCNKIWNASRFILMNKPPQTSIDLLRGFTPKNKKLTPADKKILIALEKTKKGVDKRIEKYEFGQALHILYEFFWHAFCDQYLEASKLQLGEENLKKTTREILVYVLAESLKLLHPFMPFITEEIWSQMPVKNKKLLIVEQWPV